MKKQIILSLTLLTTIITGGYVLSLYPIYTPETLERPEWLEGKWINQDSIIWTFQPDTSNTDFKLYELISDEIVPFIHQNEKNENPVLLDSDKLNSMINKFDAGVTKINGVYFLDLLAEGVKSPSDFFIQHFINAHSISKLIIKNDTMWVSILDDEWAKKLSAKQRKKIGLIKYDKKWVLTANTKTLRQFLAKIANDINAFPIPDKYFIKVKNE